MKFHFIEYNILGKKSNNIKISYNITISWLACWLLDQKSMPISNHCSISMANLKKKLLNSHLSVNSQSGDCLFFYFLYCGLVTVWMECTLQCDSFFERYYKIRSKAYHFNLNLTLQCCKYYIRSNGCNLYIITIQCTCNVQCNYNYITILCNLCMYV